MVQTKLDRLVFIKAVLFHITYYVKLKCIITAIDRLLLYALTCVHRICHMAFLLFLYHYKFFQCFVCTQTGWMDRIQNKTQQPCPLSIFPDIKVKSCKARLRILDILFIYRHLEHGFFSPAAVVVAVSRGTSNII